ncbi:MAG: hypothetical protein SGARI_005670 [Bacillariaceae sp.]
MCRGTHCQRGSFHCSLSHEVKVAGLNAKDSMISNGTPSTSPSASNSSSSINCRRKAAFVKRSLATRTISFIESELERSTCESSFLRERQPSPIAKLERGEIILGDLLGRGGFCEVYAIASFCLENSLQEEHQQLARLNLQHTTSSQYVMKHLREDLFSSQDRSKFHLAATDLVLEAQFLSRMDHPNIIKLQGMSLGGISCFANGSHDSYFLLFNRLDMILSDRIREWRQEQEIGRFYVIHKREEKLDMAMQLASALEYLHEHRIVYRDLKVDNVGLTKGKTTVQLFDFGLARELPPYSGDATDVNKEKDELFHMSGVGTRRYSAPEVVLGEEYNLQVDVYSLTLVVYEMLTHIKPFGVMGPKSHRVLVAEGGQRPVVPTEWPEPLQDLLQRGWAASPSHRPVMKEFRKCLENIIGIENQFADKRPTSWFRSRFCVFPQLLQKICGDKLSPLGSWMQ